MSVISGWIKTHAYRKTADGYKKESRDTSSQTVYMDSGSTLQSQLGAVTGVTTSLASTSNTTALAASAGTNLQGQIDTINSNLSKLIFQGGNYNILYNPISNMILLVGRVSLSSQTSAWTWVVDFRSIADKYKPSVSFNINSDRFQLASGGYIQTAQTVAPGNYDISCSWLAK